MTTETVVADPPAAVEETAPPVEEPAAEEAAPLAKAATVQEASTADAAVEASKVVAADKPIPDEVKKVYVCKYVSIPGDNEHLQPSDQNPIFVSINSIPNWNGEIGELFADAHGLSKVIATDQDPEPSVEDCGETPPPFVAVPEEPTVTPPTCDADGDLVIPETEGVIYTVDPPFNGPGTYTVTATPDGGFVFDGDEQSIEYGPFEVLPQLTGEEDCPTVKPDEEEEPEGTLPDTGGSDLWLLLVGGLLGTAGVATLSARRFMKD